MGNKCSLLKICSNDSENLPDPIPKNAAPSYTLVLYEANTYDQASDNKKCELVSGSTEDGGLHRILEIIEPGPKNDAAREEACDQANCWDLEDCKGLTNQLSFASVSSEQAKWEEWAKKIFEPAETNTLLMDYVDYVDRHLGNSDLGSFPSGKRADVVNYRTAGYSIFKSNDH
jgi:hypothetical protein